MSLYKANSCDWCQMCNDRLLRDKEAPVPPHKTAIAVASALGVAFVVFLCVTASQAWRQPENGMLLHALGVVTMGIAWVVGIVSAVAAIGLSFYFFLVNVKGVPVVYLYDKERLVHVHRVDAPRDVHDTTLEVVVYGRIGGWFRPTELHKGCLEGRTVRTWDGVHMTVVDDTGSVRMNIENAMRYLAEYTLLQNAVESHAPLRAMAEEMQALHDIAKDKQSPFGQSKYGALVYNRFSSHLVTLPTWLQMRIGPAAAKIVKELNTDERRRNSA